jgi:tRNA(Arg) A34 adenosine deaminase TadA
MDAGQGGPFGAVVVRRGKIVGRGNNSVTSLNDPTAHAEVMAIRDACRRLKSFSLTDCVIYTTCEPCPMCLAAIFWSRLRKVFYANTRDDAAAIGFDDAEFYQQMSLPLEKRKLQMKQVSRAAAIKSFQRWQAKLDKVPY